MLELRHVIALISLLAGLVLVGLAVHALSGKTWMRSRRLRGVAVLIYGLLFIGAAGILEWRLFNRNEIALDVGEPQRDLSEAHRSPIPEATPTDDGIAKNLLPVSGALANNSDSTSNVQTSRGLKHAQHRKSEAKLELNKQVATVPETLPIEDRLYRTVSRAFDVVEQFFFRNASPAVANTAPRLNRRPIERSDGNQVIVFPAVRFEAGSAQLQPECHDALRDLAHSIGSIPAPITLEIRARVDSIGPEPYNYILTQARAEVVRDILIQEGVDTHRLIATAFGSQSEDSATTGSQIRFVLRP